MSGTSGVDGTYRVFLTTPISKLPGTYILDLVATGSLSSKTKTTQITLNLIDLCTDFGTTGRGLYSIPTTPL